MTIMKGVKKMILFIVLSIILLSLIALTILTISIGGTVTVALFSDVIVCVLMIIFIFKRIIKKHKD